MLEARDLSKRYGGTLAVDKVSFRVSRGEIVGDLGPNGSGKSTTVNMVVGLIEPTSGSVTIVASCCRCRSRGASCLEAKRQRWRSSSACSPLPRRSR